ncbi:glycosyl hydrolase family 18 protein [Brevibacillus ginsengisoli]|uniref:glycosyl hydrolase family 18 protein n=1 Tax=Brevibacillus ginsengisoli TaxID=363854 RepID=UPI003CFB8204
MEVAFNRSPRVRKRRRSGFALLFLILLVMVATGGWYLFTRPSTEHVKPFAGRDHVILYQGNVYPDSYLVQNDQILVPFDFLKANIDPSIFWDEPTKSVIVTTQDKVLRMESDKLQAFLNKTPVNLRVPVQDVDGKRYVPYSPLEHLYPFAMKVNEQTQVISFEKNGDAIQQGKIFTGDSKDPTIPLREGASIKEAIVADLAKDSTVDIIREDQGWYYVQTSDGIVGYLPKESIALTDIRKVALHMPESPNVTPWKPLGERIGLVWEQVSQKNPDTKQIPALQGIQVVSPTWFELLDDQANLGNKADLGYVKWAHGKGYKVWGLVSNGFNPDYTHAVLSDFRLREKFIGQILQYARMYKLDGINLDIENVYLKDKGFLVQFVRELTPYAHEQHLTVSMDVTTISSSDRWSQFYDRAALASVVDYIAVMTYDEHWASSPKAGSVASLPWTENSLKETLKEVPKKKLLLGIPFYTRLWKEETQADGTIKVSSKAYSMAKVDQWLKDKGVKPQLDPETGQMFASFKDPKDGATYKVWLEDQTSIKSRMQLVEQYDLAGYAAWRRGFENPEVWEVIKENLR